MAELTVLSNALELLTYTCETCSALVLRDSGDEHELWHDSLDEYRQPPDTVRAIETVTLPEVADGLA